MNSNSENQCGQWTHARTTQDRLDDMVEIFHIKTRSTCYIVSVNCLLQDLRMNCLITGACLCCRLGNAQANSYDRVFLPDASLRSMSQRYRRCRSCFSLCVKLANMHSVSANKHVLPPPGEVCAWGSDPKGSRGLVTLDRQCAS